MSERTWTRCAVIILLLLEIWAFSGCFEKYFNHDSLFYLIRRPRSIESFVRLLSAPDESRQYRPLTLGFMGLIVPFFGTDPRPYHWIPFVFHLVNTVLYYTLARRLLSSVTGGLFAAAFWGLHSVAGWITYDVTCMSDFMMAFFCLSSLLLAVEGQERRSWPWTAAALAMFGLALLTKEAALPFPVVLWVTLALTEWRRRGGTGLISAFRVALVPVILAGLMSAAFAGLLGWWLRTGLLYAQGSGAAYDIDPWSNLAAKATYLYWALNLPDALHVANPDRARVLIFAAMLGVVLLVLINALRRRGLTAVQWGGLVWLGSMLLPALMLSNRLAKWYLYVPLLGLGLTVGRLVPDLTSSLPARIRRMATPVLLSLVVVAVLLSSRVQAASYLVASDAAYVSDMLEAFVGDVRSANPVLPPSAELFILPALERRDDETERALARLLSSPPIDRGRLLELYYTGSDVEVVFAHTGANVPNRSGLRVMQFLDGRLYDVTTCFRSNGRLLIFMLPTLEKTTPPRLLKKPEGGDALQEKYVTIRFADRGAQLAPDYFKDPGLWIIQYLNGHFYDVTEYCKVRRRAPGLRLMRDLTALKTEVNRAEFYPDYLNFGTPNGKPVFYATPERDIVTQIGGSTVTMPPFGIPNNAVLRFDVSWMYDSGDGGWAELQVAHNGVTTNLFREYFHPNRKGTGFRWREVRLDLSRYAGETASFVLKCYNEAGNNTVSDWLNWRDITVEVRQ